jgi:hypothetical protein
MIYTATKLKYFRSNVKYGCETWKVTKRITRNMETLINRYFREIFKMSWLGIISNKELLRHGQKKHVAVQINSRNGSGSDSLRKNFHVI